MQEPGKCCQGSPKAERPDEEDYWKAVYYLNVTPSSQGQEHILNC